MVFALTRLFAKLNSGVSGRRPEFTFSNEEIISEITIVDLKVSAILFWAANKANDSKFETTDFRDIS